MEPEECPHDEMDIEVEECGDGVEVWHYVCQTCGEWVTWEEVRYDGS